METATNFFDRLVKLAKTPLFYAVLFAVIVISFAAGAAIAAPASAMDDKRIAEGFVRADMATLLLLKNEGSCPAGTKLAIVYLNEFPAATTGCWTRTEKKVVVVWSDEQENPIELPADQVTWMAGGKSV